ncbi:hypothetical protein [Bradyrhizobium zhanjiangense]|uniref:hypothetical protein n=1 Tax=Bradyrhizobium zhanjiangense TaxID=1325107 RepID=UPI0030844A0E
MKQIQKLANAPAVGKKTPSTPAVGPADDLPAAYWASLLGDARGGAVRAEKPIQAHKLSEISRHVCGSWKFRRQTPLASTGQTQSGERSASVY